MGATGTTQSNCASDDNHGLLFDILSVAVISSARKVRARLTLSEYDIVGSNSCTATGGAALPDILPTKNRQKMERVWPLVCCNPKIKTTKTRTSARFLAKPANAERNIWPCFLESTADGTRVVHSSDMWE